MQMSNEDIRVLTPECEKRDDRRNQTYGKKAKLVAFVTLPDTRGRYWYSASHLVHEEVDNIVKPMLGEEVKVSIESVGYGDSKSVAVRLGTFVAANRPKEIVSDDEALSHLPSEDEFAAALVCVLNKVKARLEEQRQEEKTLHATQHALNGISEDCKKKAKAVCRFEQRLEALKAEFRAEVKAQLPATLAEWLEHMAEHKSDYSERAVSLVKEHAQEHTEDTCGSGLPRDRFFSSNTPWIEEKLGKDQ